MKARRIRKNESKYSKFDILMLIPTFLIILFGLVLLFEPEMTNSVISYILGALLIVLGISYLIGYKSKRLFGNITLVFSLLTVIMGIYIIGNPLFFKSVLSVIIGIFMLISGINKVFNGISFRKVKGNNWFLLIMMGLLLLFCGVLLIFNPYSSIMFVSQAIGMFLIIYGILDVMEKIFYKKNEKFMVKIVKIK